MKKQAIIDDLMQNLEVKDVTILRIYGVTYGVGYDLNVTVEHTKTGEIKILKAHALKSSWALPGHLRPNNRQLEYKGSNNPYKYVDTVSHYWMIKDGLLEYLERFKKDALIAFKESFN